MFRRSIFSLAILIIICLGAACERSAPPGPNVWAMVNGHPILRRQVERYYRSQMNQPQQPSPEEASLLKLNILNELIDNELLLEQAQKLGIQATDSEVEKQFSQMKAPYTEAEFQHQLDQRGITADQLKSELRENISIQKLINREIVSRITVSESEIAAAYQQDHQAYDVTEPEYHVAEIVVTPYKDAEVRNRKNSDATTPAQALQKIHMLLDRLRAGANFSQLAMDYSEDPVTAATGGDLGFIPESALNQGNPVLKHVVMTLQPGQISGIIRTKRSYRIIKLIARLSPGERKLSDPQVRESIRQALRQRKEEVLRAAYLASLRTQAHITDYLAQDLLASDGVLPAETQSTASHSTKPGATQPSSPTTAAPVTPATGTASGGVPNPFKSPAKASPSTSPQAGH